jgi:hypothetical protein
MPSYINKYNHKYASNCVRLFRCDLPTTRCERVKISCEMYLVDIYLRFILASSIKLHQNPTSGFRSGTH